MRSMNTLPTVIVSGVFLFYSNNMLRFLYMIEKIYDKIDINSEHKFSGR